MSIEEKRCLALIGLQWGDEGKGKIIDVLAERFDMVARFQGGHNAGHTLCVDQQKISVHLIPAGLLHAHTQCLIGNGVVVSLEALIEELDAVEQMAVGIKKRIAINPACQLLLPSHVALDIAAEAHRQRDKQATIGTTGRGIGPAYEDKTARRGLRLADLKEPKSFRTKLDKLLEFHNFLLQRYYLAEPQDANQIYESCLAHAEHIMPLLADTGELLRKRLQGGGKVLLEGAQGALLDIDHGTYPFVTSSNTAAGNAAVGSGLGPKDIDAVIGVSKAYATRVGNGPFPTEDSGALGEHLSKHGIEFGATTGRKRRCGWLDLPLLRQSIERNSVSALIITKLDVLDALQEVPLCVDYDQMGKPKLEKMPGWGQGTSAARHGEELPQQARKFLERIELEVGIPIALVSVGRNREQIIELKPELIYG